MACFFSSFLLLRMMCVNYLMSISEELFISLFFLCCGILRFVTHLMIGVCMEPLTPTVMIMGGRTFQPS